MDLTTATPVEIDTVLGEIYARAYRARYDLFVASRHHKELVEGNAKLHEGNRTYSGGGWDDKAVARSEARLEALREALDAIWAETLPYEGEFARRGGWTRFWLVDNNGGHVHSSMVCTTCFPTTEFVWLPEYSGSDEATLVAAANETACTVCFPSAPVDPARKTTIEAPARKAARLEREAAKAERDAKAAAKAIVSPDGSPLTIRGYGSHRETVKTAVAANRQMLDAAGSLASYGDTHPSAQGWRETVALCAAALSARDGKSVEALLAEVDKKVATKARREGWTVAATVSA